MWARTPSCQHKAGQAFRQREFNHGHCLHRSRKSWEAKREVVRHHSCRPARRPHRSAGWGRKWGGSPALGDLVRAAPRARAVWKALNLGPGGGCVTNGSREKMQLQHCCGSSTVPQGWRGERPWPLPAPHVPEVHCLPLPETTWGLQVDKTGGREMGWSSPSGWSPGLSVQQARG